jgi:F-type H+-transporting ATPase subunit b
MAELARQLLDLILAAVPTAVIVFLFYLFARPVFFKPIVRVLEERAKRTEGARARAARLEASAEEKHAAYRRAIDKVRVEIYAEQEAARHAALEERSKLLRESRQRAYERVREAKERLARELESAKAEVERQSARLAEEAVRRILARAAPAQESMGER